MAPPLASDTGDTDGGPAKCALDLARDATYVTIGLGILAFQRAQVQRREFERLYAQEIARRRTSSDAARSR